LTFPLEDCSEFGNFVITLIITHNLFSKLSKFKLGYDFCTKTMFCSLLSPVVCRGGSCLTYVICVCLVLLYLQLFVVGLVSYLRYLCLFVSSLPPVVCRRAVVLFTLFVSSLPPVVCRRAVVLFTLFVFVSFVFTSSCL
jgi:hypothetical protein